MSEAAALSNLPEFSVTELSGALKRVVEENFAFVRVRGEISGLKFHSSGHVYFDLKDDKAVLNAVIWRANVARLKLRPESGMEVVVTGRISTYAGSSRYQILVEQVELAGLGALMALLEERKKRLTAEGLFEASRKKKLPFLPDVIGVVTSPTGAVIRDIMHRLNARFPRRVLLWPVAVQGENAAAEITAAINGFNTMEGRFPKPDLIIVARGGGSVEDLMAFNDEAVVRAVAASLIPVISAVGHETDTTLIDFAADIRAPTPTAAAELAVPLRSDLLSQTLDYQRRMLNCFSKGVEDRRRHLIQLARVLPRPEQLFAAPRQRLDGAGEKLGSGLRRNLHEHRTAFLKASALLRPGMMQQRFTRSQERLAGAEDKLGKSLLSNLREHDARLAKAAALLRRKTITDRIALKRDRLNGLTDRALRAGKSQLGQSQRQLEALVRMLGSVSHQAVLERGFALVRGEDGKVRRRAAALKSGEALTLTFADGEAPAMAGHGTEPPAKPRVKKTPPGQESLF